MHVHAHPIILHAVHMHLNCQGHRLDNVKALSEELKSIEKQQVQVV